MKCREKVMCDPACLVVIVTMESVLGNMPPVGGCKHKTCCASRLKGGVDDEPVTRCSRLNRLYVEFVLSIENSVSRFLRGLT